MNLRSTISVWRTACEVAAVALTITAVYAVFYALTWALFVMGWHA